MSGMISGLDLVFETARQGFDAALLLDAVLDVWSDGLIQEAEGEDVRPLTDALTDPLAGGLREFFVYKDQASADSWVKEGWTELHGNDMAHFLIVDDATRPDMLQITLVIGSATEEMIRLLASVFDALGRMAEGIPALRGRSQRINWEADLRAVGYTAGREQFYDKVVELRNALFPDWTPDELACNPHVALQFCEVVRRAVAPVPDHLVMKALLNRRKQRKKGSTSFEPRLVWGT